MALLSMMLLYASIEFQIFFVVVVIQLVSKDVYVALAASASIKVA